MLAKWALANFATCNSFLFYIMDTNQPMQTPATDPTRGLTAAEVATSRAAHGSNVLTPPAKESLWRKFLEKFTDPLIVILLIAGMLSIGIAVYEKFGLHEGNEVFFEPVGIFVAIFLATGLSFYFEMKAEEEFALLNQVNDDEPVQVMRDGHATQIARRDVVVGDIVFLGTGNEVPADGTLLQAVSLGIDESTLTGEPICHKSTDEKDFDPDATFPTNYALRGTKVMEGHGVMCVCAVGDATENGRVFTAAQIDDTVKTPLNEQLEKLARVISAFSYGVAALIIIGRLAGWFDWQLAGWLPAVPTACFFALVIKQFPRWSRSRCVAAMAAFALVFLATLLGVHQLTGGHDLNAMLAHTLQTLMIAVTLIVVSVPEGLPMAVTLALALSMRRMLKTNNLVRKMHACETMGATTVICTDKTGTLTQNQMSVHETFLTPPAACDAVPGMQGDAVIAEGIAVNSTATLDLTQARPSVLGNPTEGALLLWMHSQGLDFESLRAQATKLEELPFSTERKYMATVVQSTACPGQRVLYVKGAPEIVYGLCSGSTDAALTQDALNSRLLACQAKAMRTLGFAFQILKPGDATISEGRVVAERLQFIGFAAIADPVRTEVPAAIKQCISAGIRIKIVTGDTPGTAKEIGRQIGLWNDCDTDDHITTGPEFAALSDEELERRILDIKIIARARPLDKKRLVETLQRLGQVVAVTGDGTNDAPALKAAHVGLSMGDGTSVAKEASDITIVDNSFSSIERAVMWGRSLYRNIQRFILFQMTVNVVACLIVLFGAFFGTQSPLTVTQMLWVNLIMDTFAAMALASLPPSQRVMLDAPRPRTAFIISRPMRWTIVGMGLFFTALLLALLIVFERYDITSLTCLFHLNTCSTAQPGLTPYELSLFFTLFVMLQFWNLFNSRAFGTGRSAFHFKDCGGFVGIATLVVVGQVLIVTFGGRMFSVTPLSLTDWCIAISGTSLVLWVFEAFHFMHRLLHR